MPKKKTAPNLLYEKIGASPDKFDGGIIVPAKALKKALKIVSMITKGRNAVMEILKTVYLKVDKNIYGEKVLKLIGYDLSNAIVVELSGEDIKLPERFEVVVTADDLRKIVEKMEGEIRLAEEKGKLFISSDGINLKLATYPVSEFPNIELWDVQYEIAVKAHEIRGVFQRVSFASSYPDESMPVYASMLIEVPVKYLAGEVEEDLMYFVATDGSQLSLDAINLTQETKIVRKDDLELPKEEEEEYLQYLVPIKAVNVMRNFLPKKGEEECSLLFSNVGFGVSYVEKEAGYEIRYNLFSALVEGQFPKYRVVIPQDSQLKVRTLRPELKRIIQTLIHITVGKGLEGALVFEKQGDKMYVYSYEVETGVGVAELPAEIEGETEGKVTFQGKMLISMLNAVDSHDDIVLHFYEDEDGIIDSSHPLKITLVNRPNYLYLLMPMQVVE